MTGDKDCRLLPAAEAAACCPTAGKKLRDVLPDLHGLARLELLPLIDDARDVACSDDKNFLFVKSCSVQLVSKSDGSAVDGSLVLSLKDLTIWFASVAVEEAPVGGG